MSDENKEDVIKEVSEVIIDEYENVLIERSVKTHYSFLTKEEQKKVFENSVNVVKMSESDKFPSYDERKRFITGEVRKYLDENSSIVPCGFVDFRLRDLYYFAESIAACGADMFFEEKEYEEFTYLLSVFVSEKECREEVIHLFWEKGNVRLVNKRGRDVTHKYEKEFLACAENKNLKDEDIAISAIISAAPLKIVLHSPPEKSPLKETVMKIFEGRCKICNHCNICKKC